MGNILCKNEPTLPVIMEAFFTSVILVDKNAIIENMNKKGEILFGYTKEEVIGRHVNMFVPNNVKERHLEFIHNFKYESTRSHIIGKERQVKAQKKDNSLFCSFYCIILNISILAIPKY